MSFKKLSDEDTDINKEIAKVIDDKNIKKPTTLVYPERNKSITINKDSDGKLKSITYTNLDIAEKVKKLKELQKYQEENK